MKALLTVLMFLFLGNVAAAQVVTLSGSQKRVPGSNAELESKTVKITKTKTIISVTGHHNGFWIVKNGKQEKAFWNEKQSADAVGYKLAKGDYQVYPNIKSGENYADITIKLQ